MLEPCQVSDLITLAVNGIEAIAEAAQITLHVTSVTATVMAAPDAIVQALTNLLGNAIKFSSPGSKIWLRAEIILGPAPDANGRQSGLGSLGDRPHLRLAVQDQGRGIPADRLDLVFERFQQVDVSDSRQKGGTGLGLAICKRIVDQHGGELWVESQLDVGSTFYFTLPLDLSPGEP